MISTYDWKCWDLFTWDLVHVPCIPGPWIVYKAKHWKRETDGKNASSPQNGIPWGDQVPFVPHTRRAGPSSSKPLQDKDGEGIAGQMISGWWLTCHSCTQQSSPPAPRPPTGWTWPCCVLVLQGSHIRIQRLEYKKDYKLSFTFTFTFKFIFDTENCAL